MVAPFKNYYQILGISFPSNDADIKTAYRKMARLFHPDMHPEDPEGFTAKFQEITEAHDTLSDFLKKETYDQQYRERVLGEVPQFEHYYYIEPQDFYNPYEAYEPPQPKKRNTYIPYGGILIIVAIVLKMITSVSSLEATPNYAPPTYNIYQIQRSVDSMKQADQSKVFAPEKGSLKPENGH